ncbi:Triosephosphate isomerase [Candidatus Fokinia solitaria]|uniref:Triosephosphate isomerase n=1 Tax=Candidatus Fokinia solitaria TaxID=1802984 RepID=A0A2U8BSW8_9RICK|nr:triose-phosphate isomerase family protein [Candidatus Fokinia solitaria]AWD33441.1 Triosephosphate isomerase [Candidatus Fokinia solitaria]
MIRDFFVIANWKMSGSLLFIQQMNTFIASWQEIKDVAFRKNSVRIKIVICPPHPYISSLHDVITSLDSDLLYLGAQDCSKYENGSYTGEVSAKALKEFGCSYVILGHQERRQMHENHDIITQKIEVAKKYDIVTIQCVNDHDIQDKVALSGDIIAYEPAQHIGATECESMDKISSITQLVKSTEKRKVIYGGAVNSDNVHLLYQITELDGILVGRSSLDYTEFTRLLYNVA